MATASASSSEPQMVDVKILSQLEDPDRLLELNALPLSTTVGDLKIRIRDLISSKPPPESQRLIHRGRLMARDSETLKELIGKDAGKEPQTFHLVIRDHGFGPGVSQSQASLRPGNEPPIAPQMPNIMPGGQMPGRMVPNPTFPPPLGLQAGAAPNSRSATPGGTQQPPAHHHGHTHPHVHAHPPQIPPGWPNFQDFNNHVHQHNAGHQVPIQQNIGGRQVVFHPPVFVPPGMIPQQLMPLYPHQVPQNGPSQTQVGSAPAGNNTNGVPNTVSEGDDTAPNSQQPQGPPHRHQPVNPHGPVPSGPFVQQGMNPDGSRYTMMQYTTTTTAPFPGNPMQHGNPPFYNYNAFPTQPGGVPAHLHATMPSPMARQSSHRSQAPSRNASPNRTLPEYSGPQATISIMKTLDDELEQLEFQATRLSHGMGQTEPHASNGILRELRNVIRSRNAQQQVVNSVLTRDPSEPGALQPNDARTLQSINENFSRRVDALRRKLRSLKSGASGQVSSDASSSNVPGSATLDDQTPSITAYLVNSPSGPYAMVYSPEGTFGSTQPPRSTTPRNLTQDTDDLIERTHQLLNQARNGTLNQDGRGGGHRHRRNHGRNGQARENAIAEPQAPAANGDRNNNIDEIQVLAPVLRAAWVIIRLLGFVWLFSGGSSRRTFLLVLSAVVVFAVQQGLFGDRLDRVRRYFEEFMGLPNEDRQQNQPQGDLQQGVVGQARPVGQQANAEQQQGPVHVAQQEPHVTAERLLREAREIRQGRFREFMRSIERAVALFFASLYPGIGERHVAARERQQREAEARANQAGAPAVPPPAPASAEGNRDRTGSGTNTDQQQDAVEASSSSSEQRKDLTSLGDTLDTDAGEGSSTSANVNAGAEGEVRHRQSGTDSPINE